VERLVYSTNSTRATKLKPTQTIQKSTQTTEVYLALIPTCTQTTVVFSAIIPKSTRYNSLLKLQYFLSALIPKPIISSSNPDALLTNTQLPPRTQSPVAQLATSQETQGRSQRNVRYCTVPISRTVLVTTSCTAVALYPYEPKYFPQRCIFTQLLSQCTFRPHVTSRHVTSRHVTSHTAQQIQAAAYPVKKFSVSV